MSDPNLAMTANPKTMVDTLPAGEGAPKPSFWENLVNNAKTAAGAVGQEAQNLGTSLRDAIGGILAGNQHVMDSAPTAAGYPINVGNPNIPPASQVPEWNKEVAAMNNRIQPSVEADRERVARDMAVGREQNRASDVARVEHDLKAAMTQNNATPQTDVPATTEPAAAPASPAASGGTEQASPAMAKLPPPVSPSEIPSIGNVVNSPGVQEQLKSLQALPASRFGGHTGFLAGLRDYLQSVGEAGLGHPELGVNNIVRQARQKQSQNILNSAVSYKYAGLMNRMNQDFQSRYNALEGFPQQQAMLLQQFNNELGLLMPRVEAWAMSNPLAIQDLTRMGANGGPLGMAMANTIISRMFGGNAAFAQGNMPTTSGAPAPGSPGGAAP